MIDRTARTFRVKLRFGKSKQEPCRLLQSPYLEPMARMLLLFEGNGCIVGCLAPKGVKNRKNRRISDKRS